jgi:hypothetical protein
LTGGFTGPARLGGERFGLSVSESGLGFVGGESVAEAVSVSSVTSAWAARIHRRIIVTATTSAASETATLRVKPRVMAST